MSLPDAKLKLYVEMFYFIAVRFRASDMLRLLYVNVFGYAREIVVVFGYAREIVVVSDILNVSTPWVSIEKKTDGLFTNQNSIYEDFKKLYESS